MSKFSSVFFIILFLFFGLGLNPISANNEIYWWQMREYPNTVEGFDIEVKESLELEAKAQKTSKENEIYPWQMREYDKTRENFDIQPDDQSSYLGEKYQKSKEKNTIYPWQMEDYPQTNQEFTSQELSSPSN